jgi:hypothetical protein
MSDLRPSAPPRTENVWWVDRGPIGLDPQSPDSGAGERHSRVFSASRATSSYEFGGVWCLHIRLDTGLLDSSCCDLYSMQDGSRRTGAASVPV